MLAGLSVDYVTRLEQGRDAHPSEQTLEALANALGLGADERQHLFGLAGRAWYPPAAGLREVVNPELRQLMASWPDAAGFVLDSLQSIVATNRLADALFAPFSVSRNLVEMVFLDPAARDFYVDWDKTARATVSSLRASSTFAVPEAVRTVFIARMEAASPAFRQLWERHDVVPKTQETKEFRHPAIGSFTIRSFIFGLPSAPGHLMVIWQAEPGSPDEHALKVLADQHLRTHPAGGRLFESAETSRDDRLDSWPRR